MTDLVLKGELNLSGTLSLVAQDGKVKVGENEVLVEVDRDTGAVQGIGVPVIMLPPPAPKPIDDGTDVRIVRSFNSRVTVKVGNKDIPAITLGVCFQGDHSTWPGLVLPSTKNTTVRINRILVNVVGDTGITLPNGGSVKFEQKNSGQ